MPELPEVETMRRGILGVVGATIQRARPANCRYRPITIEPGVRSFGRRAAGRRIEAVDRLGKRVVLRLDSGDSIIFEPRMTGLVLIADPPNREHLRFHLSLDGGAVPDLWYWDRRGLGSVRLLSPREFFRQLGPDKLGPDALTITADELRDRLRFSRRPIKPALLDQRVVAGVGNLYASELLHRSRIHPGRRCNSLTRDQWRRIHAAMLEVLEEAIRHEGSTLSDGTYRNALNESGGYQNHHRVYDRAGEPCSACGRGAVVRIVQAQRATFFCPRCQRAGRSGVAE
jgi:formamidopyrimidine-DNA glycosylase